MFSDGHPPIQAAAAACEAKTNPWLHTLERLAQEGPAPPGSAQVQNWNLAPFAYKNPEGTTFLDPTHTVLELVSGIAPALAVAVLWREDFLGGGSEPPLQVEMRALIHKVRGRFIDLTAVPFEPDRSKRWAMGAQLYSEADSALQGILFIRPDLGNAPALSTAVQSDHHRFLWDGEAVRQIGNLTTHALLDRDTLFASLGVRAAA